MPRPRHNDPPVRKHVAIPESLLDRVERQLPKDILSQKPEYGSFSRLVVRLLRHWVNHQEQQPGNNGDQHDT